VILLPTFDNSRPMIERLTPIQFDRLASTGRTGPAFITCEDVAGDTIEVVAKLSARCNLGCTSLAIEVLSACVAADLGLPVPRPYLVPMDPDWLDAVSDADWEATARKGSPLAFASRRVQTGFSTWVTGTTLLGDMVQTAAGILLFDAISDNPDRRDSNPNCLVRGDELRIIDHELCFSPVILFGWRPPWQIGALHPMERPGAHIFRAPLMRQVIDWDPIKTAWMGLSDADFAGYQAAIPPEWAEALPAVNSAIEKVRNARDNIDACVVEMQRVLT